MADRRTSELLQTLTPRQQTQLAAWGQELLAAPGWSAALPVATLDRCWLRLRRVGVGQLALQLPPDASAEAPELVRYRAWLEAGESAWSAQLRCWQEFGQQACQQAQRQFWSRQELGNHGWTLAAYLGLLHRYRSQVEAGADRQLPLLVLARAGGQDNHCLHWLCPEGLPMRHTCA